MCSYELRKSQGSNPFIADSAHVSTVGIGLGTTTQTMPMKFSSPASTPFALTGSPVFSPGNSIFGSSSTSNTSSSLFGITTSSSASGLSPLFGTDSMEDDEAIDEGSQVGNSFIDIFVKGSGGLESAYKVLDRTPVHNVISWTAIITEDV